MECVICDDPGKRVRVIYKTGTRVEIFLCENCQFGFEEGGFIDEIQRLTS